MMKNVYKRFGYHTSVVNEGVQDFEPSMIKFEDENKIIKLVKSATGGVVLDVDAVGVEVDDPSGWSTNRGTLTVVPTVESDCRALLYLNEGDGSIYVKKGDKEYIVSSNGSHQDVTGNCGDVQWITVESLVTQMTQLIRAKCSAYVYDNVTINMTIVPNILVDVDISAGKEDGHMTLTCQWNDWMQIGGEDIFLIDSDGKFYDREEYLKGWVADETAVDVFDSDEEEEEFNPDDFMDFDDEENSDIDAFDDYEDYEDDEDDEDDEGYEDDEDDEDEDSE